MQFLDVTRPIPDTRECKKKKNSTKQINKLRPISHSDKKTMPARYPQLICFYYTTAHLTFFERSLFNCFSSVPSGYASHKCPGISINTRQNDKVNFWLSTLSHEMQSQVKVIDIDNLYLNVASRHARLISELIFIWHWMFIKTNPSRKASFGG